MTKLPFKVSKSAPELVDVGSPEMGVLSLPKKGGIEVKAQIEINDYWLNIANNVPLSQAKLTVATIFLRHRLEAPDLTEQALIDQIEDAGLIDAVYEFCENEARRWKPTGADLEVKGKAAMAIALAHAESIGGVVCKRADLAEIYVYKSLAEVPAGCEVVQNFGDPIEEVNEVATGKEQTPTGGTSTGSSGDTTQAKNDSTEKTLVSA